MRVPKVHESGEKVLDGDNLHIDIGGRRLLSDINLHVVKGEFMCLLGPNGAGKSTLLKTFLGFHKPASGTIRIFGKKPKRARPLLGYVPQLKSFDRTFPATAVELIVASLRGSWPVRIKKHERERAMAALERVKGSKLADKPLRGLSGGETQRVFLARALVTDPQLLLLDEPAAGVDARGREDLYDLLHDIAECDKLAAVMVTHCVVAIGRTAEKIAYIDGTVQAFGLPSEVLGDQNLLARISGPQPADGGICDD